MSRRAPRDRGLTLVELIITMAIASVVLIIIGGFFVSSILSERTIRQVSLTASEVQAAARTITSAVNSASHVQLAPPPSGDDQLLVVRTAGGAAAGETWTCIAWYFDAENGALRRSTSAVGTKVVAPSGADLEHWTLLMTGLAPRVGTGIFALTGGELEIGFDAAADGRTVRIDTVAARPGYAAADPGEGDECF